MIEKKISCITTSLPIGCCGGHEYYLISINNGFTTECKCGMWCGQWFRKAGDAVNYFENMVERWNKEDKH